MKAVKKPATKRTPKSEDYRLTTEISPELSALSEPELDEPFLRELLKEAVTFNNTLPAPGTYHASTDPQIDGPVLKKWVQLIQQQQQAEAEKSAAVNVAVTRSEAERLIFQQINELRSDMKDVLRCLMKVENLVQSMLDKSQPIGELVTGLNKLVDRMDDLDHRVKSIEVPDML